MRTDFLAGSVAARPDGPALTDGRRSWSYRALDRAVAGIAPSIPAGDERVDGALPPAVAVVLPPSPEAVVAIHAVLRRGALLTPLNPGLTAGEVAAALGATRPSLVLVGPGTVRLVEEALSLADRGPGSPRPEVRVLARVDETADPPSPDDETSPEVAGADSHVRDAGGDPEGGGPAAVIWTSGTTGSPRGVLLSRDALRHSARASAARLALGPDDRWYASLSPAHVGGLALVTRAALLGCSLVATGPFAADELSKAVDAGEVTHASLVPTMLRRFLDHREDAPPPASLRCLLVGGAACPPPLLRRALGAGMPVALTWGLTETTSQAATAPPALVRRKGVTAGPPLDGVDVRVDRDAGGELLVRGPVTAVGRLDERDGATPLTDPDGWIRTGDLGELDADGHLHVTGRLSDRIITGGVNVDPGEVEAALLGHPDVAEVAVVGLPDEEWGERVVAGVVLQSGAELDPASLRPWLRGRLTGAKAPKEIVAVAELPRNPNGKVDRAALVALLGDASRGTPFRSSNGD